MNNQEINEIREEITTKTKRRSLVAGSLFWVAIGLLFTVLFAYIENKTQFLFKLATGNSAAFPIMIVLSVIAVLYIFIGGWFLYRMPWYAVLIYYILFTVIEGVFTGYLLLYALASMQTPEIILLFAIPAAVTMVMAIVGYFNLINFGKLLWLMIGLFLGVIILGITLYFVQSNVMFTIYGVLGFALYSIIIGFQFWRISKMELYANSGELPLKEYVRLTLIFGTNLLISILELIRFMFLIMKNN